jgi:hypothetical protein
VRKFLECGDLKHGFARVRCPRCREELFVPFSCRGRCFCPSCHQKRALEKAGWVSEHVCAEVLEADDSTGVRRLIQYFLRCPFSQARMIEVTAAGKVIYKTEHNAVGRFPEPGDGDLLAGPSRNFQVFDPLDFLAEVTQHIPDPGAHLVRYYG